MGVISLSITAIVRDGPTWHKMVVRGDQCNHNSPNGGLSKHRQPGNLRVLATMIVMHRLPEERHR